MSDTVPASSEAAAPVATTEPAAVPEVKDEAPKEDQSKPDQEAPKEEGAKPAAEAEADASAEKHAEATTGDETKTEATAAADGDVEMKEATEAASAAAETPNSKGKSNRRKSIGGTLNRKGSKARLNHTDAKPGDHFLVKLKGFPPWPVIICDESMLPQPLINSRPVSAARPDGTYTEAYAEGGKRMLDRTFPIMYLFTNEFGWVANSNLTVLTEEKAQSSINDKMRKDLKAAFELAVEQNPIEHYKDVLQKFEEELIAQEEAIEEARRAKEAEKKAAKEAKEAAAATPKKGKKGKSKANEDEDTADADGSAKPKSKKRKAEEDASTPQRSDSVKKPKIKLNTSTPKSANGTPSKKEDAAAKKAKPKAKEEKKPKEVKMTEAEKRDRKQKEVFFLRHKLQKGLLGKETGIDEAELEGLSHYLDKLKEFTDLEASIIRETKINKVLKAILKLETIPREAEFNFKSRSQALLEKWNKLLANAAAAAPAPSTANGVNGASKPHSEEKKVANGTSEAAESKKADSEQPAADEGAEGAKPEQKQETVDTAAPSEPVAAAE